MQETRRWIDNDREIGWSGAKSYNIPPLTITRGNKGSMAVVVFP